MKTKILQKIRSSFLSREQFESRHNKLAAIKTVKAASTIAGFAMAGFAMLNIHNGSYGKGLLLAAAAYPCYEIMTLADNSREILENPIKEFRAVCGKIKSDKKFIRLITLDAPLSRTIGMLFIDRIEQRKAESVSFSRLFSRICNKKD